MGVLPEKENTTDNNQNLSRSLVTVETSLEPTMTALENTSAPTSTIAEITPSPAVIVAVVTDSPTPYVKKYYITDTSSKYHEAGCSSLKDSKYEITRDDALAQGYEPCGRCNP